MLLFRCGPRRFGENQAYWAYDVWLAIKTKYFHPVLTKSSFTSIFSNIMAPFQWTVNSNMLIFNSFTDQNGTIYKKAGAQKKRTLLVLDDLFDEAAQNKEFLALVVAGRHREVYLMVLRHNLPQQTKNSKTIDLNDTQLIPFNCLRNSEQIDILGRQLGDTPQSKSIKKLPKNLMVIWWLISTWEKVKRWGILQIVPVTSRPSSTAPQINYLNLDNEFKTLLYSWFVQ